MTADAIAQFWQAYLHTLPTGAPHRQARYVAEAFGDNPALADELGALIQQGRKTATCSALWEWEAEGTPIPQPGLITIVLDGAGQPLCIIETTEVIVRAYNDVDAAFAAAEGESFLAIQARFTCRQRGEGRAAFWTPPTPILCPCWPRRALLFGRVSVGCWNPARGSPQEEITLIAQTIRSPHHWH